MCVCLCVRACACFLMVFRIGLFPSSLLLRSLPYLLLISRRQHIKETYADISLTMLGAIILTLAHGDT